MHEKDIKYMSKEKEYAMVENSNITTQAKSRKEKTIIYVDASSLNGGFKIGLYDKTNKVKHTLGLGSSVKNINEAEQYAVLYGLMYIQKSNSTNRHVLMNDCEGAIQDKKLVELGCALNTKLIWIPREINKADKVAKSKINKKKKVWKNLDFFMKIMFANTTVQTKQKSNTKVSTDKLSPIAKIVFEKIMEDRALFPMVAADMSAMVVAAYAKAKIGIKKGDAVRIRKELCDNNILVTKNKVIMLAQ